MKLSLVEYLTGFLTLIPIIIGAVRIKVIHKSYYWLLLYLVIDLLFELVAPFVHNIFFMNIIQTTVQFTSTFCLLMLLFEWDYLKNNKLGRLILFLLFVSLLITELVTQKNNQIKIPWLFMIFSFIWIMSAIQYITDVSLKVNRNTKYRSHLLILLPLIVTIIYYIILKILMAYLYNKGNEALFKYLYYSVLSVLHIISQICFGFAFFWAPKKEIYLNSLKENLSPKIVS